MLQILANQIKRRKDTIEQFRDAGRMELVAKEEEQLHSLEVYMPAQLSSEELEQLVDSVIAETGATSPRDMGKVMSAVMPRVRGKADGKVVNQMVREKLSG